MESFGKFGKFVDEYAESQPTTPLKFSIAEEIHELHKIKEVRDELQIMEHVSKLQATVFKSFDEEYSKIFDGTQQGQASVPGNGENMPSPAQTNQETADQDMGKLPLAISDNLAAIELLLKHADEAQTAVNMSQPTLQQQQLMISSSNYFSSLSNSKPT